MASITSKGIDIERKEIFQGYGKPPPEGLIPVGDMGIYLSPNVAKNKPVSPFDCNQWPDSPYCGGVPWTRTPIGFDIDFGYDGCGAWIQGTPIIGFTKLPQVSAAWRRPGECRDQKQPEIHSLPEEMDEESDSKPPQFPTNIPLDAKVIAVFTFDGSNYSHASKLYDGTTRTNRTKWQGEVNKVSVPGDFKVNYLGNPPLLQSVATVYGTLTGTRFHKYSRLSDGVVISGDTIALNNKLILNLSPVANNYKDSSGKIWNFKVNNIWGTSNSPSTTNSISTSSDFEIAYGKYEDIVAVYSKYKVYNSSSSVDRDGYGYVGVFVKSCRLAYLYVEDWGSHTPKAPPPDYKKRDCECMQCCGSGQAQDRRRDQENAEILALLRLINRKLGDYPVNVNLFDADDSKRGAQSKVEKINSVAQGLQMGVHRTERNAKAIGIDELPIYVPSSMIEDESNGLLGDIGDIKNKVFKQRIDSVMEFNAWKAKNDYEIFGRWHEVIIVEDADPTKKGNQPKRVVLPNMAKTFKELVMLNSTQIKVLGLMMDTMLKMYIDVLNTKVSSAVTEQILKDVQDFLDYPTTETQLKVPIGATIPSANDPVDDREDIEKFLQNSTVYAKFDDWTGEGSLHDMMLELLQSAKVISAQFFNKI